MKNDILKKTIDRFVKESVIEYHNNSFDTIIENVVNEQISKLLKEGNEKKLSNKKRSVIKWLKSPAIDAAEIRRKLEGEPETQQEEDSKRSYFMKKVNQSYGKDFTDEEVNTLYAIKSELGQ